ncbi:MAG: 2,3-bisphosphoglycerate-independent phosphoglycerate mutase [Thermodesulfobacteriota bacterium]
MRTGKKLYMLMILDGWGINPDQKGNAIASAHTPFLKKIFSEYPNTSLLCSGKAVGLPEGIMGNSEVGHLNIGAGRIVYQDLLRIDMSIEDRSFFKNAALLQIMEKVKEKQTVLHLMGLLSDGGVHSQLTHLQALLEMAKSAGLERVCVHAITDGRDTPPHAGKKYMEQLLGHIRSNSFGTVATICGRFFAMDRDNRWDRVDQAYRMYTLGAGTREHDPVKAIENAYSRGETDEFIKPVVLLDDSSNPLGTIQDGDGIIFFNFRADRAREITRSFTEAGFNRFHRESLPRLCGYVCMTLYDETFTLPMAFPPAHLKEIFGEVISKKGLKQLRIAETEKYAHVTYFFNGGEETPFPLEDRCLIPSPRDVQTYDYKPEMSAYEVTREVLHRIQSDIYDVIILNFANMDMVGHTGIFKAAVRAVEAVDRCIGDIVSEVKNRGGVILITADHGNAEIMIDKDGQPHTAHSMNPVPFVLVDDNSKNIRLRKGILADIAPTLLELMEIEKPVSMTGGSLIENS